jgi:hypothetical protein
MQGKTRSRNYFVSSLPTNPLCEPGLRQSEAPAARAAGLARLAAKLVGAVRSRRFCGRRNLPIPEPLTDSSAAFPWLRSGIYFRTEGFHRA